MIFNFESVLWSKFHDSAQFSTDNTSGLNIQRWEVGGGAPAGGGGGWIFNPVQNKFVTPAMTTSLLAVERQPYGRKNLDIHPNFYYRRPLVLQLCEKIIEGDVYLFTVLRPTQELLTFMET
jgi:hypothetical protein